LWSLWWLVQALEQKWGEGERLGVGAELGVGAALGVGAELGVGAALGLELALQVADHLQSEGSWSRTRSRPPSSNGSKFRRHKSLCMAWHHPHPRHV